MSTTIFQVVNQILSDNIKRVIQENEEDYQKKLNDELCWISDKTPDCCIREWCQNNKMCWYYGYC